MPMRLLLAASTSGLGPWLTLLSQAPGAILLPLRAQPVPHTLLWFPGTSGFIRNNNNKQRVTLYFLAVFHPESSKHFTDKDSSSSVKVPGTQWGMGGIRGGGMEKGTESSSLPDWHSCGAGVVQ